MTASERLRSVGVHLLVAVVCLLFAFPVLWLILTAFRPPADVFYVHASSGFSLDNFRAALKWPKLGMSFWNSAVVATLSTLFSIVITVPSGYMLARFPGRFASTWFFAIYLARAVPFVTWLLPLYLVVQQYSLYDTYTGVVMAQAAFHVTFFSWVMKGFFEAIPMDMEEAGYLDGCSRWSAFIRITLPSAVPGIIALSILGWLWSWNELLFALILTGNRTPMLTVTMGQFINEMGIEWGAMAATAVLALVPAVLFTVFTQKYIVKGLGGLGG